MTAIQTPFGSQAGRYAFLGSMSLTNCHAEIQGDGGKSRYVIIPCDGIVALTTDAGSLCRGLIYMEDLDAIYSFHSSSVWKVTENGTSVRIGTLPGIDKVQITRNKKSTPQITVLCDAGLYFIENDEVRIINSSALPAENPVSLDTLGEYTLLGYEDGRVFYSTQSETTLYNALNFFTAEQSPDSLVKVFVDRGELFLFGKRTIEAWAFTGAADSPFEFRTLIQKGLMARDTVVSLDGTIMWLGHDEMIYRLEGYSPKRISVHEVERLVHADTSAETIIGFAWSHYGHSHFAVKGTNWTRVFDAATGQWHTHKSRGLDVWRAQYCILAWNKAIFGDQQTGKLFYFDQNTYTEDGEILTYEVITPPMHIFPNGGIVDNITIDFLSGQGVTTATAQGYDPILMVSYSDDGGNTFSHPRHLEMGKQGAYDTRIRTHRLGRFRDKGRIWKLSVSDPVGRALSLMDAKVRPLAA